MRSRATEDILYSREVRARYFIVLFTAYMVSTTVEYEVGKTPSGITDVRVGIESINGRRFCISESD